MYARSWGISCWVCVFVDHPLDHPLPQDWGECNPQSSGSTLEVRYPPKKNIRIFQLKKMLGTSRWSFFRIWKNMLKWLETCFFWEKNICDLSAVFESYHLFTPFLQLKFHHQNGKKTHMAHKQAIFRNTDIFLFHPFSCHKSDKLRKALFFVNWKNDSIYCPNFLLAGIITNLQRYKLVSLHKTYQIYWPASSDYKIHQAERYPMQIGTYMS